MLLRRYVFRPALFRKRMFLLIISKKNLLRRVLSQVKSGLNQILKRPCPEFPDERSRQRHYNIKSLPALNGRPLCSLSERASPKADSHTRIPSISRAFVHNLRSILMTSTLVEVEFPTHNYRNVDRQQNRSSKIMFRRMALNSKVNE